jgi:hypothetical protein
MGAFVEKQLTCSVDISVRDRFIFLGYIKVGKS